MEFLKQQYAKSFAFFFEKMKAITLLTTLLFILVTAASAFYMYEHPQVIQDMLQEFMDMASSNGIITDDGISSAGLMTNNIKACFMSVTFGIIPFLFLPLLSLITNAALIGGMIGLFQFMGLSMSSLAAGILPHGIFELPALLVSMGLGIYLCKELSCKLLGKRRETSIADMFLPIFRFFLCIVIPLLVAAGIIEAYITPLIMNAFM